MYCCLVHCTSWKILLKDPDNIPINVVVISVHVLLSFHAHNFIRVKFDMLCPAKDLTMIVWEWDHQLHLTVTWAHKLPCTHTEKWIKGSANCLPNITEDVNTQVVHKYAWWTYIQAHKSFNHFSRTENTSRQKVNDTH